MKYFLFVALSCFMSIAALGKGTIRGSVFDEEGYPLMSATVVVKGTTIGTVTDLDGAFSLSMDAGTYDLEIKCISCQPLT